MRLKTLKFSSFLTFVILIANNSVFSADQEKCKGNDSLYWTNCIGSIATNGEAYVGQFQNGLPHGKGTYTYKDGATYVGEFANGKESGEGMFYCWVHGAIYEGAFKNGKKHGFGKYNFPNGDIYEGQWRKGKRNGKGKYIFKNGLVNEGIFSNNKFIE
tara:strand:- start:383 stop:856 length:474 start_codon:yes stop_codon:yes gene_type:complete